MDHYFVMSRFICLIEGTRTLNLVSYAHICKQAPEKQNKTSIHKHAKWMHITHPGQQRIFQNGLSEFVVFVLPHSFFYMLKAGFFFYQKRWSIHTASVPSAAETHTGGGAVLGKPEGSPARRHSRKIDLKQTLAYAEIQTNEEQNRTHIRSSNLIFIVYMSLLMLSV